MWVSVPRPPPPALACPPRRVPASLAGSHPATFTFQHSYLPFLLLLLLGRFVFLPACPTRLLTSLLLLCLTHPPAPPLGSFPSRCGGHVPRQGGAGSAGRPVGLKQKSKHWGGQWVCQAVSSEGPTGRLEVHIAPSQWPQPTAGHSQGRSGRASLSLRPARKAMLSIQGLEQALHSPHRCWVSHISWAGSLAPHPFFLLPQLVFLLALKASV